MLRKIINTMIFKISVIKMAFIASLVFISSLLGKDYYSNSNKSLFVFPEYASLGGAALVFSRDAAPLSNPANIPLDSTSILSLVYSGYFENTFNTTFGSFVMKLNENIGFGVSIGYLYVPDIPDNRNLEYDEELDAPIYDPSLINYKSSSEIYLNIAFGYNLLATKKIGLSVGASLHCLRRRLIDWTGYGIGADAGATLILRKPGVLFSLFVDDITTNYIHWSQDYHDNGLPHARLGIGWRREFPYIYGRISIMYKTPDLFSNEGVGYNLISEKAGNMTEPQKNSVKEDPSLLFTAGAYGFEYVVHKIVALRIGLDESKRVFFGSGVNLFKQSLFFDFAYMVSYELPSTYSLSMSYRW